jgi:hypothetical protein
MLLTLAHRKSTTTFESINIRKRENSRFFSLVQQPAQRKLYLVRAFDKPLIIVEKNKCILSKGTKTKSDFLICFMQTELV